MARRKFVRLLVCAALCAFAQAIAPCAALAAERTPLEFNLNGHVYDHSPIGETIDYNDLPYWYDYTPNFHDFITTSIDGPTITTSAYTAKTRSFTGQNGAVSGYFNFPLSAYTPSNHLYYGGINSATGGYDNNDIPVWRYFDVSYMTIKQPWDGNPSYPPATMVPKIPIQMNGSSFTVPAVSIDVPQVASTVSTMHNNGYLDHEEKDEIDTIHLKSSGVSSSQYVFVTYELNHAIGELWPKGSVFQVAMSPNSLYINGWGANLRRSNLFSWMYLDGNTWTELPHDGTGGISVPLPKNSRSVACVYRFNYSLGEVKDIYSQRPHFWLVDNSVEQTIERETEQQTQTLMDTSGSNTLLNGPLGTTDQIQQRLGFVGTAMEVPASIVQGLGSDAATYVTFPGFSWNGFTLPAVQVNPWAYLPELETPVKSIVTGMFVFAWFRGVRRWFGKTFLGEEEVHIDDDSEE